MQNGSFVDYYGLLMIGPTADIEMLEASVRLLLARYDPRSAETGDKYKFELVKRAYLTLSDPHNRAAYDTEWKQSQQDISSEPGSAPLEHSASQSLEPDRLEDEKMMRQGVLRVLYQRLTSHTHEPGVAIPQIATALGVSSDDLQFTFWFLREKGFVVRMANGSFSITINGVEHVENRGVSDLSEEPAQPLLPKKENETAVPDGKKKSGVAVA